MENGVEIHKPGAFESYHQCEVSANICCTDKTPAGGPHVYDDSGDSGGLVKLRTRRRAFSREILMQTFMHTLVEDFRPQYHSSFSGTFGQDVQHCCCG